MFSGCGLAGQWIEKPQAFVFYTLVVLALCPSIGNHNYKYLGVYSQLVI